MTELAVVKVERTKAPPFLEQLDALQDYLRREVPERLSVLYRDGTAESLGLLPLATGREHEPRRSHQTEAETFADAQERFASVLGHAIGNAELAAVDQDHVWPRSLLTVEDIGCAIYRAIDLDDPALRVVQYEHLDPVDDPLETTQGAHLAYAEPTVPRCVQHRFTVIASSLDAWIRSKGKD